MVTGELFISIDVPVFSDGRLIYLLRLNIEPILPRIVADLHLPQGWLVNIADRAGYTIARSLDAERYVGQMGRPELLARLRASDYGSMSVISREGIPIDNAFAHVKFSGWILPVGVPDGVLFAPVRLPPGYSSWRVR